jgi:Arc/MetJ-type ribon-helix-helix transcriptional regulator
MTIQLPEHLERYVHDQVLAGRFRSEVDVILDALERHRQAQQPLAETTAQPSLTPEEIADLEVQRRLLAAGVISEIMPPITDLTPFQNRRAVPIQGEPISETAIRQRR